MFLNWFKVVFFLSFLPTFGLLLDTLNLAAPNLLGFLVVFLVVFSGFAQAHTMVFGMQSESYATFERSSWTLLRALLGDFDYMEMYDVDPIMAPLFFIFYITLAIMVILNMSTVWREHTMIVRHMPDHYCFCHDYFDNKYSLA